MSESFDPRARTLIVPARVVGPREAYTFNCALDTGATHTVLPTRGLRRLGFDLSRSVNRGRIHSATGNAPAALIRVPAITALGRVRTDYVVAAHDLPLGV